MFGRYVGGVKENYKTADQDGLVYTHAPKAKQKEAVKFITDNLFNTPKWMLDQEIIGRLQDYGCRREHALITGKHYEFTFRVEKDG